MTILKKFLRSLESENNTADEPIDTNEPQPKKLKCDDDVEWNPFYF